LNGNRHILVCTDDVNRLGEDINIVKENTGILLGVDASLSVEVKVETTEQVVYPRLVTRPQDTVTV
jgi:hypothetical protein